MSVEVGKVYQQVLLLTKDDRTVELTPEKFNLLAEKAQLEIFEKTFHDYKLALRKPNAQEDIGDELSLLEEKIAPFRIFNANVTVNNGLGTLVPTSTTIVYDLLRVHEAGSTQDLEQVTRENFNYIVRGSGVIKIMPIFSQKIFYRRATSAIEIYPTDNTDLKFDYIKVPTRPMYKTATLGGKTFSNNSIDFQLHISESGALVNKILELVGIMKNNPIAIQTAGKIEATNEVNKDR